MRRLRDRTGLSLAVVDAPARCASFACLRSLFHHVIEDGIATLRRLTSVVGLEPTPPDPSSVASCPLAPRRVVPPPARTHRMDGRPHDRSSIEMTLASPRRESVSNHKGPLRQLVALATTIEPSRFRITASAPLIISSIMLAALLSCLV